MLLRLHDFYVVSRRWSEGPAAYAAALTNLNSAAACAVGVKCPAAVDTAFLVLLLLRLSVLLLLLLHAGKPITLLSMTERVAAGSRIVWIA